MRSAIALLVLVAMLLSCVLDAQSSDVAFIAEPAEGTVVQGMTTPCLSDDPMLFVVATLNGFEPDQLKAAGVVFNGQFLRACWAPIDTEKVWVITENGAAGYVELGKGI